MRGRECVVSEHHCSIERTIGHLCQKREDTCIHVGEDSLLLQSCASQKNSIYQIDRDESPSLEVLKSHVDVVLRDMV